jgi:hypothetical protein
MMHIDTLFQGVLTLCTIVDEQGIMKAGHNEIEAADRDADRALLKLFHAALKGEKVARALEVAAQLRLPASLQGALRLANHHR